MKSDDSADSLQNGNSLLDEVIRGLQNSPKQLTPKFFYDKEGSRLFNEITRQPEYYPTRTEIAILTDNSEEIANLIGERAAIIEYGSGSIDKAGILLENLECPVAYVPVDISGEHLQSFALNIQARYENLKVFPVVADYTNSVHMPRLSSKVKRRVVFFPGSSIGNFTPEEAQELLSSVLEVCGDEGGLVLGVDLKKDPAALHRAYNDQAGITAKFNLNMLKHINRNAPADFDLKKFRHYAFYNPPYGRIEMHLVSLERQTVIVGQHKFLFDRGETIWTESSYKYSPSQFASLAGKAGFKVSQFWTDAEKSFSVQYLHPNRL